MGGGNTFDSLPCVEACMMRLRFFFLFFAVLVVTSQVMSQPQLARDHVRGPGGRVVLTVEPDNFPPSAPVGCSASQSGPCAIDGIDVSWGAATDIGSGVAGYNGPGGFTTGFSYHDGNVSGGECYTYYVSAVDNAGHSGDSAMSNTVCIELCTDALFAGAFSNDYPHARKEFRDIRLLSRADETSFGSPLRRRKSIWAKFVDRSGWALVPRKAILAVVVGGGQ